jgi:D-alanyl-D-alanine carboxypeptidase (penicillin-binding protein 5/6)
MRRVTILLTFVMIIALVGEVFWALPSLGTTTSVTISKISPTQTPHIPSFYIPDPVPKISARSAYILDPDNPQKFAVSYHGDTAYAMASTTKIMTALVVLLTTPDLKRIITIPSAISKLPSDASVMHISAKQKYSVQDLLYGLLLPSGDDAAIALAIGTADSEDAFVTRMNTVAGFLQLHQTQFANAHGLDEPNHHTSAHDLAVLTGYALQNTLFRQIVGTEKYTIPANSTHPQMEMVNTNKLLDTTQTPGSQFANLGIDGVKTGYTGDAGRCLVIHAQKDKHNLIVVVMGEKDDPARFTDSATLLSWGFQQLQHMP